MTRCFTMLKPGVLNRRIAGEVITRFEKKGLKLIGIKMFLITHELAEEHYSEHKGKPFYEALLNYVTSAPVVAMVWQGEECISIIRKLIGATNSLDAVPGTIRGDFCINTQHNIIHASDKEESAAREIALFFSENEIFEWQDSNFQWY